MMSEVAGMAVGVVVGGAIASSFTRTMRTAEQRAEALGARWGALHNRLRNTGDVVRYQGELKRLRAKQAGAAVSSERLDRGVRDLERRYRAAKRELRSYGVQVGDAVREHRRLQREMRATAQGIRGLETRAKAAARLRGMRGIGIGAAGAALGVGRLLRSGMQREEQQLYLRTVIIAEDGDKDAAVGRAVAHAREQARRSLASETEILEIQYALNSAGLGEQAARAGSELVHRLAKVTRGESGQVGQIVGGVLDNMGGAMAGDTAAKLQRIGDVLAQAQFRFAFADFGQLGESFKEAAPGALSAGLAFEDTAAAVGVLNNAQLTGGRAGTALNAVMRNLSKAAGELGTQVVRGADGGLDLVGTLTQIQHATAAMGAQEKQDTYQRLFGDEGLKGVIPLLANLDDLRDGIGALHSSAGAIDGAYGPFLRSASGQWTMLTTRLRTAGDTLAQHVLPAVTGVVGGLADMASSVGAAIERWPGLGQAVVWFGVGLAGVTATVAGWNAIAWIGGGVMSMWAARTRAAELAVTLWERTAKAGAVTARAFGVAVAGSRWAVDGLGRGVGTLAGRLPFLRAGLVGGAGGFGAFAVGAGAGATAMRVFRAALIATGVGAILVAIGVAIGWVVSHWGHLRSFFAGVGRGFASMLDAMGPFGDALRTLFGWVGDLFGWIGGLFAANEGTVGSWGEAGEKVGRVVGAVFAMLAKLQ